jgi:hypothetical protein
MFHVAYLVHVYIPGRYILVASINSFIIVIARAPFAEVLHLLHELLGKGLGDQRVPVDIRARLKGRGATQVRWLFEGIHGVMYMESLREVRLIFVSKSRIIIFIADILHKVF